MRFQNGLAKIEAYTYAGKVYQSKKTVVNAVIHHRFHRYSMTLKQSILFRKLKSEHRAAYLSQGRAAELAKDIFGRTEKKRAYDIEKLRYESLSTGLVVAELKYNTWFSRLETRYRVRVEKIIDRL